MENKSEYDNNEFNLIPRVAVYTSIFGKYDVFENVESTYYLEFPNDESELDVNSIIEFRDKIYKGKERERVHREIRDFAKHTVDIDVAIHEVIDYIGE